MNACPFCGRETFDPTGAPDGLPCERCADAVDVSRALGLLDEPGFDLSPWASRAGLFLPIGPRAAPGIPDRQVAPGVGEAVRRRPRALIFLAGALLMALGIALGILVQFLFLRQIP